MPKWVRSKYSEEAKKWEVHENQYTNGWYWRVNSPSECPTLIDLPMDEYVLCDPQEQWQTCTRDAVRISVFCKKGLDWCREGTFVQWVSLPPGYCWAWSEKDPDALIIQRKVQL